ncbi:UNVERIFIED_CONTAM: hypothetical protein GTU68_064013 [Idotea baltica]|nr:hypothetical protein [Idotea baltica]
MAHKTSRNPPETRLTPP